MRKEAAQGRKVKPENPLPIPSQADVPNPAPTGSHALRATPERDVLIERIMALGAPNVLLAGDFMLDMYVYGDAERISPEAPVPVLKVVKREYRCGGAASVAAVLSALGAKPTCLGVIGEDAPGKQLLGMLRDAGAATSGLLRLENRPTTTKQRLVGLAQHRHQQQLMRVDDESDEPLDEPTRQKISEAYTERLPHSDVVCLQDYGKGVLADGLCQEFIAIARKSGKILIVDPARIPDYGKYKGAHLITPNRFEASTVVGFEINDPEDAQRASEILIRRLDLNAVIITMDRDGAFVKTNQLSQLVPTTPKTVYDVSGAGDVVLATLALALAAGCDCLVAVQLANIAAGIAVEKFGTATVTTDEMIAEMHSRNVEHGGKAVELNSLLELLKWHRRKGETIVFTNGCFDILHQGHTTYLDFCKAHGDVVVVGLNSDSSVGAIKGPTRPINNQRERAAVLAALESVTYVVAFDNPSVLDLVKAVNPDILVKGADCRDREIGVVGREFVESQGGTVLLAPLVDGKSSTATLEKIRLQEHEPRKSTTTRIRDDVEPITALPCGHAREARSLA